MKLTDFINDPVTALVTLIGAVIISMFGAFIKDGIVKLLSKSSIWWKEKQDKELAERDRIVESLVNNQPYLILFCTKTIISNISIILLYLLIFNLPSILSFARLGEPENPQNFFSTIFSLTVSVPMVLSLLLLFIGIITGISLLFLTYSVSKRNLIIVRATKMIQNALKDNQQSTEDAPKSTEDAPKSTEDAPKSTEDTPKSTEPLNISTEQKVQSSQSPQKIDLTTRSRNRLNHIGSESSNRNRRGETLFCKTVTINNKKFVAKNGRLFVIHK